MRNPSTIMPWAHLIFHTIYGPESNCRADEIIKGMPTRVTKFCFLQRQPLKGSLVQAQTGIEQADMKS